MLVNKPLSFVSIYERLLLLSPSYEFSKICLSDSWDPPYPSTSDFPLYYLPWILWIKDPSGVFKLVDYYLPLGELSRWDSVPTNVFGLFSFIRFDCWWCIDEFWKDVPFEPILVFVVLEGLTTKVSNLIDFFYLPNILERDSSYCSFVISSLLSSFKDPTDFALGFRSTSLLIFLGLSSSSISWSSIPPALKGSVNMVIQVNFPCSF